MSLGALLFRTMAGHADKKRDSTLTEPTDVTAIKNINYAGNTDMYNMLDVYYPKGTEGKLPVILSIHGGGFVYGTKEIYKFYGMYLAQQGFVFVNFSYHLAPDAKFPSQLKESNMVVEWMVEHADEYHMDLNNAFIVGDSAGAQMTSQYAAIYSNKEYAKLFPFTIPEAFHLRAIGLNCGIYDISPETISNSLKGMMKMMGTMMKDYLGNDPNAWKEMLDVLGNINENYPPTYVMTAYYDMLKNEAEPMYNLLKERGVDAEWKCYGTEDKKYMQHVCHVNMNLEEAKEINNDECAFFRKYII